MNYKPILIVAGEPNSIFTEILLKSLKKIKNKKSNNFNLFILYTKETNEKLKLTKSIKILDPNKIKQYNLNNKIINLINIDYKQKNAFQKISSRSNKYIEQCFNIAFKIIKKEKIIKFINGPISKKYFLKKKHLGMTEYISNYFSSKKTCMLIFNKKLSVSPTTTHLPIKLVSKKLNTTNIRKNIVLIEKFYKEYLRKNKNLCTWS